MTSCPSTYSSRDLIPFFPAVSIFRTGRSVPGPCVPAATAGGSAPSWERGLILEHPRFRPEESSRTIASPRSSTANEVCLRPMLRTWDKLPQILGDVADAAPRPQSSKPRLRISSVRYNSRSVDMRPPHHLCGMIRQNRDYPRWFSNGNPVRKRRTNGHRVKFRRRTRLRHPVRSEERTTRGSRHLAAPPSQLDSFCPGRPPRADCKSIPL